MLVMLSALQLLLMGVSDHVMQDYKALLHWMPYPRFIRIAASSSVLSGRIPSEHEILIDLVY